MSKGIALTIFVLTTFLLSTSVWAVTLEWDANTASDLAGYKLYYGTASATYSNSVSIQDKAATSYELDLDPGTYYLTLTALDETGNESGFSNEVTAVVAAPEPPGKPGTPTLVP